MGARYYDPVIGRFTGIDPAAIDFENPHGLNRFAYANNNPCKFVDPDGRLPVFVIPLIIKAIDVAFTAHDVYTAAQQGGAAGVAKVAAENAVLSAVPGGKIGNKIVDAVRKADVPNSSIGAMRRAEFEPAPYHRSTPSGRKSPGPVNGQGALDNSLQVSNTSTRRVGIDPDSGDFVIFDQTSSGTFHGHVRAWNELTQGQQAILRRNFGVDETGHLP